MCWNSTSIRVDDRGRLLDRLEARRGSCSSVAYGQSAFAVGQSRVSVVSRCAPVCERQCHEYLRRAGHGGTGISEGHDSGEHPGSI